MGVSCILLSAYWLGKFVASSVLVYSFVANFTCLFICW